MEDYKVLIGRKAVEIEEKVNYHIMNGYVPIGGVSVTQAQFNDKMHKDILFSQAVIKMDSSK